MRTNTNNKPLPIYPLDRELALHRQREIKMEDFQEYFDYCEECKAKVREALEI